MKKACRDIIDHLAEGDPLDADHQTHLSVCPTCARTMETRDLIRATTERRNRVPPRPGFASRAAAGALRRAARRRRWGGIGLIGATVAAGAATVAFFSVHPKDMKLKRPHVVATAAADTAKEPAPAPNLSGVDELLDLSDIDGTMSLEADWSWLEEPVAQERLLAEHLGKNEDEE